ncbi:MAG: Ig-like domain-containing protein [Gemmatimonadales bacterium]|nr:Ig-like domain-containing protein [Gemmatimonadales bacterium]
MTLRSLSAALIVLVLAACGGDGGGDPIDPNVPSSVARESGAAQVDTAGAWLAEPLAARVRNAAGAPVAGVTVLWTVRSGGGTLTAPSSLTDADGIARVGLRLGPAVGTQRVEAQVPAIGGAPVTFDVVASAPPGTVAIDSVGNGRMPWEPVVGEADVCVSNYLTGMPSGLLASFTMAASPASGIVRPSLVLSTRPDYFDASGARKTKLCQTVYRVPPGTVGTVTVYVTITPSAGTGSAWIFNYSTVNNPDGVTDNIGGRLIDPPQHAPLVDSVQVSTTVGGSVWFEIGLLR